VIVSLAKTDIVMDSFLNVNLNQFCRVPIITVYKNTSDYPDKCVARLWDIHNKPTKIIMINDNIESIRDNIPKTMNRFEPSLEDDSVIVEIWV
jgi:hypothetical protein